MKTDYVQLSCYFCLALTIGLCNYGFSQSMNGIPPRHKVTLPQAHVGSLEIDTMLLNSYGALPENVRQFYEESRAVFSKGTNVNFTSAEILKAAQKYGISLMGGPMLGNLEEDEITVWLRPSTSAPIKVKVKSKTGNEKTYLKDIVNPGEELRIMLDGLAADTEYNYSVFVGEEKVGQGTFRTAPQTEKKGIFKLAFGSDFHKIGLHNPNIIEQILKTEPRAMMLLGDLAVDDRENNVSMHRSDYLLRDVSKPWTQLASNVPLYTAWDDHDYFDNDLSGIPEKFTEADREALRAVWQQNWNNPVNEKEGIFFNTRIGPVELIMLDTRSCRKVEERGQYGSYLGLEQMNWLKNLLLKSTAPFKVISSGTMWSDAISNGKDSWGTWDTLGREEIFNLIEAENIPGVLLISGDRHGARGFTIPRPSGFRLYEFEAGTLGGVPGPDGMAKDPGNQLFGYDGTSIIAFGEFIFNTIGDQPLVTFGLIDESGAILEEHELSYDQLTPQGQ